MSPEMYYELHIKDKPRKSVEKEIRSLKRQNRKLRNILANKDDMEIIIMSPSYEMQLDFNLDIIKMAEAYLQKID